MKLSKNTKNSLQPGDVVRRAYGFAVRVDRITRCGRAMYLSGRVVESPADPFSIVGFPVINDPVSTWYGAEIIRA